MDIQDGQGAGGREVSCIRCQTVTCDGPIACLLVDLNVSSRALSRAVGLLANIRGSDIPGPEPKSKILDELTSVLRDGHKKYRKMIPELCQTDGVTDGAVTQILEWAVTLQLEPNLITDVTFTGLKAAQDYISECGPDSGVKGKPYRIMARIKASPAGPWMEWFTRHEKSGR